MAEEQKLTDHDKIRQWASAKGGQPAMVSATARHDDGAGVLRIAFEKHEDLEEISWDTWFETFEQKNLALLVDEDSQFNKLVER